MKIFAHRGSSLIWPENTLFAFEQANKFGATGFETDLRLSKDDEILLSHDDNLARFGHPDKTISQLAVEEIETIQIHSKDTKYKDNIIRLETLLKNFPEKHYIFDCKITSELLIQKLANLFNKISFHNNFWFLTWSSEANELLKKYFPYNPCFPREAITRSWGLKSIFRLGNSSEPSNRILALPAYHMGLPVFNKKQIDTIKAHGKEFVGYLVNSERDFLRCKYCGVSSILTDRPDIIKLL